MKMQRSQNSQKNLGKNKVEGLTLPHFKTYYKITVIKSVWYQNKDKHIDRTKQIPEMTHTINF